MACLFIKGVSPLVQPPIALHVKFTHFENLDLSYQLDNRKTKGNREIVKDTTTL